MKKILILSVLLSSFISFSLEQSPADKVDFFKKALKKMAALLDQANEDKKSLEEKLDQATKGTWKACDSEKSLKLIDENKALSTKVDELKAELKLAKTNNMMAAVAKCEPPPQPQPVIEEKKVEQKEVALVKPIKDRKKTIDTKEKKYSIQIAAFLNEKLAKDFIEDFNNSNEQKLKAFLLKHEGSRWFNVQIGHYSKYKYAFKAGNKFKDKGLYPDFFVFKNINIIEKNNTSERQIASVDQNQTTTIPQYTIQIKAFREESEARSFIESFNTNTNINTKDFKAYYYKPEETLKSKWYCVRIGRFTTRKDAKNFAKILIKDGKVSEFFISKLQP